MGSRRVRVAVAATAVLALSSGIAAAAEAERVAGPAADGTAVTPVGYTVTPAGRQTDLGNLPLSAALSPDGRHLLVSNDGQGTQSLQVVDVASGDVTQTISYAAPQALYVGLAFSPDGHRAYASAGGNNKIRTFDVAGDGTLTETASTALPTRSPDGRTINPFPAGLAVTPDGGRLVVADQLADALTVVDLATRATATVPVGHRPFGVALSPDGATAYVTNQGADTVTVADVSAAQPAVTATIIVGSHPNKLVLDRDGRTLYVADGDSDEVSVVNTAARRVTRTVDLAPYRDAPVGSNPTAVALSPDERTLYVANSGNNDVAVVDVASGRVRGLIPTAWYPTAVVATGDRLFVTNAKGLGAGPNNGPGFPNPERGGTAPDQYTASMMVGTLSQIDVPDQGELRRYTHTVRVNNDVEKGDRVRGQGPASVIPRHPGAPTPIKHVIYVVRENRTYDQVFGNLGRGNGDPSLTLFGDESAPNARELARRFVTLDNFYTDAEVSAQAWNWVVAANSNPYSEGMYPANYSPRGGPYPSENGTPEIAPNRSPDDSYIWQRLDKAGISFRNYGFYVGTDAQGRSVADDPVLNAHTDPVFRGFTQSCPDSPGTFTPRAANCGAPRISEWLREFRQYEADGDLPTVEFVRLPNDHTSGTSKGAPTPKAYVADNDWALGQLVDAVSHSTYWSSTAILVTEDDAQNGPDHVDAHRTVTLVVSPYSQHGRVDSTFYNTASLLRTMELVVGIGPLTQFDAYSTPMLGSFSARPNPRAYDAIRPSYPMDAVNGATAPLAAESAAQDLSAEDRVDTRVFNEAIWKSVKGADSPMPEPRHAVYGAAAGPDADD